MRDFVIILVLATGIAAQEHNAATRHGQGWRNDWDWNRHEPDRYNGGWGHHENAFNEYSGGWGHQHHEDNASGAGGSQSGSIKADNRSLDDLYKAAIAEGGKLIVYAGGDSAKQLNGFKDAFETQFPGITVEIIVDFSKYQDARIDNQLATGTLIPDVVHLQTLQDFPRWKDAGVLMQYKPIGWDAVFPQFKDADGYYTAILGVAFSNNVNTDRLPNKANWPTEANDYLRPDLKGKIVSTYPNDDDAVLFWYKLVIEKYGWSWLEKFVANEPIWVRGAQYPSDMVGNGSAFASFSTDGYLGDSTPSQFVLPKADPFVSWAQLAAIFKNAKNPNTAKLYMSWFLDVKTQRDKWYMWSVRQDVSPPAGFKNIFGYPGQTDPTAFGRFMSDRAELERFKTQVTLYVGEVQGPAPPGKLGLHPVKALDA